jgi:hypothetical protein
MQVRGCDRHSLRAIVIECPACGGYAEPVEFVVSRYAGLPRAHCSTVGESDRLCLGIADAGNSCKTVPLLACTDTSCLDGKCHVNRLRCAALLTAKGDVGRVGACFEAAGERTDVDLLLAGRWDLPSIMVKLQPWSLLDIPTGRPVDRA